MKNKNKVFPSGFSSNIQQCVMLILKRLKKVHTDGIYWSTAYILHGEVVNSSNHKSDVVALVVCTYPETKRVT
jgi:hypothetical protein